MRALIATPLMIIGYISGGLMWLAQIFSFSHWWGGLGFVIGVVMAPGIFIFPALFWFMESVMGNGVAH